MDLLIIQFLQTPLSFLFLDLNIIVREVSLIHSGWLDISLTVHHELIIY
jgi:hypothetical protein